MPSGWSYVLPTEAEWEYACRAGTTTAYSWGATIATSNANYNNTIDQTTDVGQYAANPWGFFDMHGNVYRMDSGPVRGIQFGSSDRSHRTGIGLLPCYSGRVLVQYRRVPAFGLPLQQPPEHRTASSAFVSVSNKSSRIGRAPNWFFRGERKSHMWRARPGRSPVWLPMMYGMEI